MSTHANGVRMTVSGAPGTGTITLNALATGGLQTFLAAFGAVSTRVDIGIHQPDGTLVAVERNAIYDGGSPGTIARGTPESPGALVSLTAAAVVSVVATADMGNRLERAMRAVIPGGRLSLEAGVPVSATDQSSVETIRYVSYVHNVVPLWDGVEWVPITFTETALALGTLISARPYDVFAFLSDGALALELLAWTNNTTRATAVTLQDGRYCKSGDKSRLLLGSFYSSSTTATMDTAQRRFVSNAYNQVPRRMFASVPGESTSSGTIAEIDNTGADTFPRLGVMATLLTSSPFAATVAGASSVAGDMARYQMMQNGSGGTGLFTYDIECSATVSQRVVGGGNPALTPGYHYLSCWHARLSGSGNIASGTAQMWGSYLC